MNLSSDAAAILRDSIIYATEHHYEYVTPEVLMLLMCNNADFRAAFEECGGNVNTTI